MDDRLVTLTYLRRSALKTGAWELRLEDGVISVTPQDGHLLFRAPLEEVHATFPKFIWLFPPGFPVFGIGMNLTFGGTTYRLSFVGVEYEAKARFTGVGGVMASGPSWSVSLKDFKPARAAVRQWRAALAQPTKGALRPRCLECGAETTAAAQVCARCGAPIGQQ